MQGSQQINIHQEQTGRDRSNAHTGNREKNDIESKKATVVTHKKIKLIIVI